MSGVPFSWLWGDPAENLDRLRAVRSRMEKEDAEFQKRERKRKKKRIKELTRQAMNRQLKGQR